jgi:hypothetical protein
MNRKKQAQKAAGQVQDFLKRNPAIREALCVFEISHDQYQKALEGGCSFYTDVSTSPPKVGFRSHSCK